MTQLELLLATDNQGNGKKVVLGRMRRNSGKGEIEKKYIRMLKIRREHGEKHRNRNVSRYPWRSLGAEGVLQTAQASAGAREHACVLARPAAKARPVIYWRESQCAGVPARLDRCHGLSYSIRLLIDGRLRSGCSDAAAEGQGMAKTKGRS